MSLKRITKYTFEIVLVRAHIIHGDNFDYSLVRKDHIVDKYSLIPIKCTICQYAWLCSIDEHIIRKCICPNCSKHTKWTLHRFLFRAKLIHGIDFDYSLITENLIINTQTKLPITCNKCGYFWMQAIKHHINSKSGCPDCAHNAPWTLERFLARANLKHGVTFNYDKITVQHIKNALSRVPITCTICKYELLPTIDTHINTPSGCPNCADTDGDRYDYSKITEKDVRNANSRLSMTCNKCQNNWCTNVTDHINRECGCPICKSSKGERKCNDLLIRLKLPFESQFKIQELGRKRFDFMFEFNNNSYIIELDGKQHHEFVPYFHKTENNFLYKQSIDIEKTITAVKNGYYIIRIDHTQFDNIYDHISEATKKLTPKCKCYFTNASKYEYIIGKLPQEYGYICSPDL
jgi:predicted Zn-ribbon and HTH transcriptional regulator/very-short-patch-repair endonuclease